MANLTQAYYFIGNVDQDYSKVYDGKKLQANSESYQGYLDGDTLVKAITNGNITHVNQFGTMEYDETLGKNIGTLDIKYDNGYPQVWRDGVEVTDEYVQTQVADPTFTDLTPGCKTFTIISRDITLQSETLTKEYDGTALTGKDSTSLEPITDSTAGMTDKGYVSGEVFTYTFTGSQLFVGESDNSFDVSDSNTALTTDYNVTKQYGKLIVTARTSPLTITVGDQTKTYDGTASINTTAYTVTGDLAYNDTITVTLSNSNVDAGTYTDSITATYTIMHDNGDGTYTDVTRMYANVTVDAGDLTVNKRNVTITSASDTKAYDGTALTDHNTSVTSGSFVAGEGYVANVTGSQTEVGGSANTFTVGAAIGTDMNNYNVTKVEGTLTVTGFGDAVFTADSNSKMYDGTALTDGGYTVTGLADGHTATATTAGSVTHFSSTDNTITSYTILDANGNDVTVAYNSISTAAGTLSITKRDATLTSGSATKKYDGTPLTNETVTVSGSGFVNGEGATYYNFASQTAVGSTANTFSYVLNNGTFSDDYDVTTKNGTLTVIQNDTLITITADSDSKMYDGSALTDSGYTVTGSLATGDYFYSVTVTGSITDAGTAANTVTGYVIKNQAGDDVTSFYSNIQTVDGTLEVTKRSVTLTSATGTKPYDGTPLTNSTVTVTGDGWAAGEGATYDVTGSQTEVGTSKNTFSYTLNSNTKAGNYSIEPLVEGDLTVTPAELIITIDTEIGSGLEFLYDNTSTKVLSTDQYQVEGLVEGDKVVNVTITTNSANAGTYDEDMYTLTYDVVNAAGEDVSGSYIITEYKHDVDITKRTITIAAGSDSKVYDSTALTNDDYEVVEGKTEEYQLLDGEEVEGVGFTADSTITHAGSTANKIDASNVTITKADGSDSSMNYNILTEDGTLTVTQRGVMLKSTSAEKFYDGTALQNRQVIVTGFHYDENGNVVEDSEGGFLKGDGCTYDFVNDNVVIDAKGNIIAWTVSEQSDTAYGQTEVGSSKNEFNYNNFTSVYAGSFESDYIIMYGDNQESLGLDKDEQDLYGDLTVWGGPVEINLTDYSWTYDYQAKTNGYFDDGYTVVVTTNEEGTETETTEIAHNSEGYAIGLLGSDTIVVTVTGEDGSVESGKVQHVGDDKQNGASYAIYRNGEDVTSEVERYYQISIDGGLLKITPRTVELVSASDVKEYDGEELTNNTVTEGSEGRDKGFIFGEGAAYEVTGSQIDVGTSENAFAISELLTDTKAADYNFVLTYGSLTVTGETGSNLLISNRSYTPSVGTYAYDNLEFGGTGSLELVENVSFTAEYVTITAGATATITGDEVVTAKGKDSDGRSTRSKTSLTIESGAKLVTTDDQLKAFEAYKKFDIDGSKISVDGDGDVTDLKWAIKNGVSELSFTNQITAQAILFNNKNVAQTVAAADWIGVNGKADSITTSAKTDVAIDANIDFKDIVGGAFVARNDKIIVGADAKFYAKEVNFGYGTDTLTIGARSTATFGKVTDLERITVLSGKAATNTAEAVFTKVTFDSLDGSYEDLAHTFAFGNYTDTTIKSDVKLDNTKADRITVGAHAKLSADGAIELGGGNDTLSIGAYAEFSAKSLDFGDTGAMSADKFTVGARSVATIDGAISGVNVITTAAGIMGSETDLTAGDVTMLSGKANTVSLGKCTNATLGKVTFGSKADRLTVGYDSTATFKSLDFGDGANQMTVGVRSDVTVTDSMAGALNKLTVATGKGHYDRTEKAYVADDSTVFHAGGEITGTDRADAFTFGNYTDVSLGDVDFGKGNDKVTVGAGSKVIFDSLDFGDGTDTLAIGKGSTVTVNELDVEALDKLSIGAGSVLYLGADVVDDAKSKFSRYADQIKEIQLA